jgi:GPH family glycoside/pentoside/hexuronide:cation symporter
MTVAAQPPVSTVLSVREGLRYGLLGFPLAFCALPLYVLMPNLYAREWGVPLAALGAVLLVARLFDAVVDPWLGRVVDRLFARSLGAVWVFGAAACAVLALGFCLLFLPQVQGANALLWWAGVSLVLTYLGYSALAVAHQSWGARLGGDERQRSHIVAWREGLGLLGVVLAAVTSSVLGVPAMLALLLLSLVLGWWAWTRAPRPAAGAVALAARVNTAASAADLGRVGNLGNLGNVGNVGSLVRVASAWGPWRNPAFRKLLLVYLLNGIASAIPATLVLFFVQDRVQGSATLQAACLGLYFVCGAVSMPLWLRLVGRIGLSRAWLVGMVLSITVFLGATQVGAGDAALFLWVCALSGLALGSDLALPPALLAGVIADGGDRGRLDGTYFGWWNFATKLNLALAAGVALPLLAWLGYVPGARDQAALQVLTLAYCLLPCALKTLAAGALYLSMDKSPAVGGPTHKENAV